MKIASSSRLQYQLMTADDEELMYQLDQDPEVMRFINGGKKTTKEEIQKIYIPRMQSYTNVNNGWGLWKVLLKNKNIFIGWILIRPIGFFSKNPEYENLEMGWRFHRNYWGHGYASEAAKSIKQELIKQGKVKKLSAIAIEGNSSSIRIMRKLGMIFIKKYIHDDPLGSHEVVYYQVEV